MQVHVRKLRRCPFLIFRYFFYLSIFIQETHIEGVGSLDSRFSVFYRRIEPTTRYPLYTHQSPSYGFTKHRHGRLSLGKTHTSRPPMQTVAALTEAHLQRVFSRTFALRSLFNNALLTLLSVRFIFKYHNKHYAADLLPRYSCTITLPYCCIPCAERTIFVFFPPPHCRSGTFLQTSPFPLASLSSRRPVTRAQRVGEWKRSPLTITPFAHRIFSCTFLLFLSFSILPSVEDVLYHEGKVRCNCLCVRVCALRQGCGFGVGGWTGLPFCVCVCSPQCWADMPLLYLHHFFLICHLLISCFL